MYHPKVFRVWFNDDQYHRIATMGGMDSEYSHTTREKYSGLVVANYIETAKFLWSNKYKNITTRTDIVWEELGSIDIMVDFIHGG